MKKVAVVYHSGHGNTEVIAKDVVAGLQEQDDILVRLFRAEDLTENPTALVEYDGLIWGSPTYLGGVSGVFKQFMDATGKIWSKQLFKGKLASGFTVSSLPAGDKQSTLLSMFIFSMQHGMVWVGNPFIPEQHQGVAYEEAVNRLGSWSGLMAQASHASNAALAPGDLKTARKFGENFSQTLRKYD
ncbi:MAG TPA: flavodoxin family protein [Pseudomonadales bacterium]|nr:flavodoxin family protein [Pseudomonadales bacterium]